MTSENDCKLNLKWLQWAYKQEKQRADGDMLGNHMLGSAGESFQLEEMVHYVKCPRELFNCSIIMAGSGAPSEMTSSSTRQRKGTLLTRQESKPTQCLWKSELEPETLGRRVWRKWLRSWFWRVWVQTESRFKASSYNWRNFLSSSRMILKELLC